MRGITQALTVPVVGWITNLLQFWRSGHVFALSCKTQKSALHASNGRGIDISSNSRIDACRRFAGPG